MRLMIPSSTMRPSWPVDRIEEQWIQGFTLASPISGNLFLLKQACETQKLSFNAPLLPFAPAPFPIPFPDDPLDPLGPLDPLDPFPVGTSGSATGTVGVSDGKSEGTELVDGSELGTKEGSSLGISEGSSLGPLLGISLGCVDGALEGSMLEVGAEVAADGPFVGSSLGRLDGSLLGSSEGSLLGDDEGTLDGSLLVLGL